MALGTDLSRGKFPLIMRAGLSLIAKSHTLRCDAKQAESRFAEFERLISSVENFYLGHFLPKPLAKGEQPRYIEDPDADGVPVISTIVIQRLSINLEACRYITQEDFDAIDIERKPKKNDVLLTLDGGTSIGKPVLFELEGDFAIDSHVAILRPVGLDPKLLAYLLASPLGQIQFQQAESGASGQTSVTEEDLRRFRFPVLKGEDVEPLVAQLDQRRQEVHKLAETLKLREAKAWSSFNEAILSKAATRGR